MSAKRLHVKPHQEGDISPIASLELLAPQRGRCLLNAFKSSPTKREISAVMPSSSTANQDKDQIAVKALARQAEREYIHVINKQSSPSKNKI